MAYSSGPGQTPRRATHTPAPSPSWVSQTIMSPISTAMPGVGTPFAWPASLAHGHGAEEDEAETYETMAVAEKEPEPPRPARWAGTKRHTPSLCRGWRAVKGLFSPRKDPVQLPRHIPNYNPHWPQVRQNDWDAYGQWARPQVNGVQVHNATPLPNFERLHTDPQAIYNTLRGPNNSPHPENWMPRMQHPAVPQRPPFWHTPDPARSPIPPWACQLNPFLVHNPTGPTLITFDIGRDSSAIIFTEPQGVIPLLAGEHAQPATFPFVTTMAITSLADDPTFPSSAFPSFPWPITVRNPLGITCEDVFEAVYENFQQHLNAAEYNSLSAKRKEQVGRAYWTRCRTPVSYGLDPPGSEDGCRRIDYMVDRIMFRGLEPSPSKDGSWMMFVGPP